MASEVDICNLALSRLGDDATVTNLLPPEGSAQAEHCARFYPIARDSLLEQHDWNFATRRATLAAVAVPDGITEYQFAYAVPNNYIKLIAVLPPNATSDTGQTVFENGYGQTYIPQQVAYVTQPFVIETNTNGDVILLTNQSDACAIFTVRISDTTKFSPLFVDVLAYYLASYLAGPILKGETGRSEGKSCMQFAMNLMGKATTSDANQRFVTPDIVSTGWIANR